MNNNIAFRLAWNRGFEQRLAELGMTKAAGPGQFATKAINAMRPAVKTFVPGVTSGNGATSFARNFGGLGGPMEGVTLSANARRGMSGLMGEAHPQMQNIAANRQRMADLIRTQRGTKQPSGAGAQIPQRAEGSFGATPANYLSNKLWNDRTPWQRAGVVGGGLHVLGTHNQARGAQKAYDDFQEAHPILSTFARLGGVQRPGYFSTFAGRALNPTNALGIL